MSKPTTRTEIYAAMREQPATLTEDANIYAAMVDDIDDEIDSRAANKPVKPLFGASRSVTVLSPEGAKQDAASLGYVEQLEKTIRRQDMELKKLGHLVRTLGFMVRQQRDNTNQNNRSLTNINRELDNKIDRRD